jgi:hypothetical protein
MPRFSCRTVVALIGVVVASACGGAGGGESPPQPVISSFAPATGLITSGTSTTLTAVFSNGTGTVDHGVGSVTSGTPFSVSPVADTTYTLTVTNTAGVTTSRKAAVQVVAPPAIISFVATPSTVTAGDRTVLAWNVTGATSVSVDNGIGSVAGSSQDVTPGSTTTYTLTAANAAGVAVTAAATVTVVAPSVIISFVASPAAIAAGRSSTLSWSVTGATGLSIDHGVGTVAGSSTNVSPTATTTYTLTAVNAAGASTRATATVLVEPAPAIASFTASPATITAGNTAVLAWSVAGAPSLSIDQLVGDVTGTSSRSVKPLLTTTYTLAATSPLGAVSTARTTVTVVQGPVISNFTATPALVALGQSSTLTAVFIAGTGAVDHGLGAVASGVGTSTGNLTQTTTFTLVVTNLAGDSVTATTTIPVVTAAGTFSPTGSTAVGREWPTATLLPNGKVLVAGGFNSGGSLASAEIYDPSVSTFTASGSMNRARANHLAVLLPSGKVFLTGGTDTACVDANSATSEIYDPASQTFAATDPLCTCVCAASTGLSATLLDNGKVLLAGGLNSRGYLAVAELYDPGTGSCAPTGFLSARRSGHSATLLANGTVLVAGGFGSADGVSYGRLGTAEIYDPSAGAFTPTGALGTARNGHTATLLPASGQVLVAGGYGAATEELVSAELYDPSSQGFRSTGALNVARSGATATLVANGTVLLAGGRGANLTTGVATLGIAEIYDPGAGTFAVPGAMSAPREYHAAALLRDGRVLLAGGYVLAPSGNPNAADLFTP